MQQLTKDGTEYQWSYGKPRMEAASTAPFEDGFATTRTPPRPTSDYARRPVIGSVSPLLMRVALHYWTNGIEDYEGGDGRVWLASATQEAIGDLLAAGLLRERTGPQPGNSGRYERTEGLGVWIEAVLRVPFPVLVQMWVMPGEGGER